LKLPDLVPARFIRRYGRFTIDARLADGSVVQAHCPNPGRLTGLTASGIDIHLSEHPDPNRRLKFTWESVRWGDEWVGINTFRANRLAEESIRAGMVPVDREGEIKREVDIGRGSRLDFFLPKDDCYLEVKNVTLGRDGLALFPDAVTARGRRHLQVLADLRRRGHRAIILFIIQRNDLEMLKPAYGIDPEYGMEFGKALESGVEALALACRVSERELKTRKGGAGIIIVATGRLRGTPATRRIIK